MYRAPVDWWQAAIIALAGVWAGLINAVVGSGTLVTFPTLVALGYPPLVATTSNALGLVTGAITGAVGYRAEIVGQAPRIVRYGIASALGAIVGTILLLSLPEGAFERIVPVLIVLAVALVAVQPVITKRLRARRAAQPPGDAAGPTRWHTLVLFGLIFAIGIYGGYFTAAQGVMLVGVLGLLLSDPLQRINGIKNVLSSIVNVVAGVVYAFVAPIDWRIVGILAVSSIVGGLIGAKVGRKLPPLALRIVIIVIGLAAVVRLVWF